MVKLSRLAVQADAHADGVWSCAWAPGTGGPALLSGSVDETVKAWQTGGEGGDTLRAAEEYTGHLLGCVCVAASATGLAATTSLDSVTRVWDLASGVPLAIFEAAPGEAWSLAFPPGDAGGRQLASAAGAAACVQLWNLGSKEVESTYSLPPPVRLAA